VDLTIDEFDETVVTLKAFSDGTSMLELAGSDYDAGFRRIKSASGVELHATHVVDGVAIPASDLTRKSTLTAKGDTFGLVDVGAGVLGVGRVVVPAEGKARVGAAAAASGWAEVFPGRVVGSTYVPSTELNNHTAVLAFDKTISIPANTLGVGQIWRYSASGLFSCDTGPGTNGLQFRIRFNGVGSDVVYMTGSPSTGWANIVWNLYCDLFVTAVGATGKIRVHKCGGEIYTTTAIGGKLEFTIDTTAAIALVPMIAWTTGSVGNKAVLNTSLLERLA
jgi:hypothetical protein